MSYKKTVFLLILLVFASLLLVTISFFNPFEGDDAMFTDTSLHLLKGEMASMLHGNWLGCNKYIFNYPPLHIALTAVIFKLFGANYLTAKFVSVFFAILLAILISVYCYKKFNLPLSSIIVSLILFDHLFLNMHV